jgi:hypothetical protein
MEFRRSRRFGPEMSVWIVEIQPSGVTLATPRPPGRLCPTFPLATATHRIPSFVELIVTAVAEWQSSKAVMVPLLRASPVSPRYLRHVPHIG